MYDFEFGSRTAKGGFANEKAICGKFNNWEEDEEAKLCVESHNILDSIGSWI